MSISFMSQGGGCYLKYDLINVFDDLRLLILRIYKGSLNKQDHQQEHYVGHILCPVDEAKVELQWERRMSQVQSNCVSLLSAYFKELYFMMSLPAMSRHWATTFERIGSD